MILLVKYLPQRKEILSNIINEYLLEAVGDCRKPIVSGATWMAQILAACMFFKFS